MALMPSKVARHLPRAERSHETQEKFAQSGLAQPSARLAVATAAGFPILRMAVHATPRLAAGFASAPDLVGKFNATL